MMLTLWIVLLHRLSSSNNNLKNMMTMIAVLPGNVENIHGFHIRIDGY
jgi:hypothetical protein